MRVRLGFAVLVTTGGSVQLLLLAQFELLPKLGALKSSPGLMVRVITPPLTLQASKAFTEPELAVRVHAPSGGAVCVQVGPCVPSVKVTVSVPSGFEKLAMVKDTQPLSSVWVLTGLLLTPVAVIGQWGIRGSPSSWEPLSFKSLNLQT